VKAVSGEKVREWVLSESQGEQPTPANGGLSLRVDDERIGRPQTTAISMGAISRAHQLPNKKPLATFRPNEPRATNVQTETANRDK
jgi:hypothetical protein